MRRPIKRKALTYKYKIVMLVDDNELDNFINQKIIESSFFAEKIYINTSGSSALEFLKNLAVNKKLVEALIPDVIFLDINMPLMDGFQFMDEYYKLQKEIKGKTKIVILTTSMSARDKEMATKYGAAISFINKPLNEDSLSKI